MTENKLSQMAYWVSECQKCAEHHGYNCDECPERHPCMQTQLQIKAMLTPIPEEKLEALIRECGSWVVYNTIYVKGGKVVIGEGNVREILQKYESLRRGKEE